MLTRRQFMQTAAAATSTATAPKRIAIITTAYQYLPTGNMGDRFLVGYPWDGAWHRPDMKVVSLYVDQHPSGDLSAERAAEFGFRVYPTIAQTLRAGSDRLAVDAVLIIAGHGEYRVDDKGQTLYPQYEFFEQCVKVFEQDGRAVPIFNDQRLSHSFDKAKAMVDAAHRLRFPVLAGSALPVTFRLPALELPLECRIADALMIGVGGFDAMDFPALEALQCMVERRSGGETGVQAVQLVEGEEVWKRCSPELLTAALSRSDTPLGLTVKDGRTQDLVASGQLRVLAPNPAGYFIEYRDGFKAALLMLNGAVKDFNFAARVQGVPELRSTQFLLTPEPNVTYSACLMHETEQMFATGRAPYLVERTLLAGGILEACLTSKMQGHRRLETPHLGVRYRPV